MAASKGGRPSKKPGQPKRVVIQVAVSAEEDREIRDLASTLDESVSAFCYKPIMARVARERRKRPTNGET